MHFIHFVLANWIGVTSVLAIPPYSDVFRSEMPSFTPSAFIQFHAKLSKRNPDDDQTNRDTDNSGTNLLHRDATRGNCKIQADGRVYQLQKGFAYEVEVDAHFVAREEKCAATRVFLEKTNSTIVDWWCDIAPGRDALKDKAAGTMLRFATWYDPETFTDDQINLEIRTGLDATYPGVKFVEKNICSFAESLEPTSTTGLGDNVDLPEEYEDNATRSKRLHLKSVSRRQLDANQPAIHIHDISPSTAIGETTPARTQGQLIS